MDQHQIVEYPVPDAEGYYVMRPHLRMAFLPPAVSDTLLQEAQLVNWNQSTHRLEDVYAGLIEYSCIEFLVILFADQEVQLS